MTSLEGWGSTIELHPRRPQDSAASAYVGLAGFEPATPCSQSRCAAKLRHSPYPSTAGHGKPAVPPLLHARRMAQARWDGFAGTSGPVTPGPYRGVMQPPASSELLDQASCWNGLSRWERSELGRALRRLGWSYGEIMGLIPVPKGTLAGWCADIRLADTAIEAIRTRSLSQRGIPRDTQGRRRSQVEQIRRHASEEAGTLSQEPLWVAGTALYWGEGGKTKKMLSVTNADPRLLRVFLAWVRRYHDSDAEFVLALHLHEGNGEPAAKAYWREAISLNDPDFYKTYIKPGGTGHRKNHLPHGICRVLVRRSTDAWHRTMAWIDALAAIAAGDEQPSILAVPGSLAQPGRATDS